VIDLDTADADHDPQHSRLETLRLREV